MKIKGEIGRGWEVERILSYDQRTKQASVILFNPASGDRWVELKELHELHLLADDDNTYLPEEDLIARLEHHCRVMITEDGQLLEAES
jgi:hypothetical protein